MFLEIRSRRIASNRFNATIDGHDGNNKRIDKRTEYQTNKLFELPKIILPHAFAYENTVMVKSLDTGITELAVPCEFTNVNLADWTKSMVFNHTDLIFDRQSRIWKG